MTQEEINGLIEKSGLEPDDRERLVELYASARREAGQLAEENRSIGQRLEEQTRAGVEKYRAAVLAADPELPPDFVKGASFEEVDERLAAVRAVQQSAEKKVAATMQQQVVATPTTGRSSDPFAGLQAESKIAAALASRR
ncbi:MAG: hypothetical protein WEB00_09315 [Dehalococcoidia bacterium]